MSYIPIPKAPGEPIEKYLDAELNDLARALVEPKENFTLQTLYAAPSRPIEGMVVKADGTTWNPGSGAGTYQYRAGTWRAWEGGGGSGSESNGFYARFPNGHADPCCGVERDHYHERNGRFNHHLRYRRGRWFRKFLQPRRVVNHEHEQRGRGSPS